MQQLKLLTLVLMVFLLSGCLDKDVVRYSDLLGTNGAFNAKSMISNDEQIFYQVYLPEGLNTDSRYPLLVSLHGDAYKSGDSSTPLASPLVSVWHGGADFSQNEKTLLAVPKCPEGQTWSSWANDGDLENYLDHLIETYPVAIDKIYLSGYDAGGTAVWQLLESISNRIAAASIVSAEADVNEILASPVASVPQLIFASEDDPVVAYSNTLGFVDSLWLASGNMGVPNDSIDEDLQFVRFPAAQGLGHETEAAASEYADYLDFFLSKAL